MRLTGSGTYTRAPVPRMPPGLVELMEGLTKDVLRNNPTNIYEFCANHMKKLIEIRDGPSRKKSLTLEEKIAIAQKKVRQRAKEQQEQYDNEMLRAATTQPENVSDHEAPKSSQQQPNNRPPVHHEQELSLASEVEISHEPSTDNSLTSKDYTTETHEIPISKSSTVSSISKSTVIDLLNNDLEKTNKDIEDVNGLNLSSEGVAQNENPDEISIQSHISESIDRNVSIKTPIIPDVDISEKDLEEPLKKEIENKIDTNDQNVSIETTIIPDEDISAKNSDVALKKEIENKNDTIDQNISIETPIIQDEDISVKNIEVTFENETENKNDVPEKAKVVNLDSENQMVDSGTVDDNMNTSIEVTESSPRQTELEVVNTTILTDSISSEPTKPKVEDQINMDDSVRTAGVSVEYASNVNNEQSANTQIAGVEKLSPEKTVIEDSPLLESDIKLITHVQPSSDTNTDNYVTKESPIPVVDESNDEHTIKAGYEQSDAIEVAEIHNETETNDQVYIKNDSTSESLTQNMVELEEIEKRRDLSNSKEKHNELDIKEIKIDSEENVNQKIIEIAANEDCSSNKNKKESTGNDDIEKISETLHEDIIVDEKKDEIEITKDEIDITPFILDPDSVDNDGSNSTGTEISKADEDIPQNDNENAQNNMDLETAAVTIQKVFRSFLFKSRNSTFEDITNDEAISLDDDNDKKEEYYAAATVAANLSQDRRPLGLTRMDTVLQTVNEEKSLSLSTDDSSTLSSAATTIQAHVRGFLVRNKLNSYKTVSTNSLVNSNEMLDTDSDQKSKTVLNIHIVPEQANYLSRDESLITSMDLSLDGSPPSSVNLHPLSYDLVSERRKLLKREDAIQSVSPPSNNSGKLSEDSVKEVLVNENDAMKIDGSIHEKDDLNADDNLGSIPTAVADVTVDDTSNEPVDIENIVEKRKSPMSPDASDVVTPFATSPHSVGDFENTSRLLHSGEFHDVLLPTKVSRSETTVVREFKNVLAYILLWNAS